MRPTASQNGFSSPPPGSRGNTLPELFAGFKRTPDAFPVLYVQANVLQAWASESIFDLLFTMLRIRPSGATGRLHLSPSLPEWWPDFTLRDLRVLGSTLDLQVFRRPDGRNDFSVLCSEVSSQVVPGQEHGDAAD